MDKDTHTHKTVAYITALADITRLTTAITSFWFWLTSVLSLLL